MARIFIAGPHWADGVTNWPAFLDASEQLMAAGHEPLRGQTIFFGGDPEPMDWAMFCEDELRVCDGAAVLAGYELSPGAMFEVGYVRARGKPTMPLSFWTSR